MTELADLVVCPRCHGDIHERDGEFVCTTCGVVGRRTLGHPDFTGAGRFIPLAAGGTFDLDEDVATAERILRDGSTFEEMFGIALELAWETRDDPGEQRAVDRAARRYERVEAEAGDRHGEAILDKVRAAAGTEVARADGIALEAGGGFGKFVRGFRTAFGTVVFVDCSLARLVVAAKLAEEQGLDGVVFVRADVTALPFRADQFDFVHQNGVIEHVPEPASMVRESLRVTRPDGVYACLSPNRYPITREPHFEIRLFGIYPPAIRRWLTRRARGVTSEAGTDLQSLRSLRRAFRDAGRPDVEPFFLPPRLPSIARRTRVRRVVQQLLDRPAVSRILRAVVNGPALAVMPYHLVVTPGADHTA